MDQLTQRIKQLYPDMTKAQKAVAAYVLDHFREIPFFNITDLAKQIGVSETTIINFCITLELEGFGSFKKMIASQIHSELNTVNKLAVYTGEPHSQTPLYSVFERDIKNMQATMKYEDNERSFHKLLSMIEKARRIFILGFRSSAILSQLLAFNLRQQGRDVNLMIPGVGDYLDVLPLISREDLVITFSFSRYSAQVTAMMEYMYQKQIPLALITDMHLSDGLQYSSATLCCDTRSDTYLDSYTTGISMINAIVTASAVDAKEQTDAYLQELEGLFDAFSFFSGT